MWCVIPAAGRATRLGRVTAGRPKALLEISGKSLIEHLLARIGDPIDRVCVIATPDALGSFQQLLGDRCASLSIAYATQPSPAGVANAVGRAEAIVEGPFVVLMGDCYFDGDFAPLVTDWKRRGDEGAVLVEPATEADGQPMGLVTVSEGRVAGIYKAPWVGQTGWRVAGAYLFPEVYFEVAAELPPSDSGEYELEDVVTRLLRTGARFSAVPFEGWRRNVNTPDDLAVVERRVSAGPTSSSDP